MPDLVLSDIRMPGDSGVALLELLRERAPYTDVVLMTAYEDMTTIVTAMREGAVDFIVKPIALMRCTVSSTASSRIAARAAAPRAEHRIRRRTCSTRSSDVIRG